MFESALLLEVIPEESGLVGCDADGGEDDRESLACTSNPSLSSHLSGNRIMWKPRTGEEG
jgi:hypothetical protein